MFAIDSLTIFGIVTVAVVAIVVVSICQLGDPDETARK